MQKIVAAIAFVLTQTSLFGQTFDTEFYPRVEWNESSMPTPDDHIFSTPAWGAPDPFGVLSRYRFGVVRYRARGLDGRYSRTLVAGVDLSDNISSYPDWSLISLVRRSGLGMEQIPAMVAGGVAAGIGGADNYSPMTGGDEVYVLLRAADRYSRAGADVRHSHEWDRGWSHRFAATGQFGTDGHIRGVSSNEGGIVAAATKKWNAGGSLSVLAAGGYSQRGARSAATEEAFSLTRDPYYNPNWGWQDGRVRNSRINSTGYAFAAATFETPLGTERTLRATVAYRYSRGGRGRLAWYDASSPMPDYYRKMPSAFPDWSARDIITEAWKARDPSTTQIDWDALYYNNTLSTDGRATYIMEQQVERANDVHLNIEATREFGKGLELSYGVRVRRDRSRFFKVADDMLGAGWVSNVDQYVTEDDTDGEYHISPPNENDLRNPGRRVGEGERFGYDYALTRFRPSVFGIVRWNRADYGITASASLDYTSLSRRGFYEKELFPGAESFGRSRTIGFTTYSIGASAYWNVSVRHSLSLSALVASEAPFADDVFFSPEQNNFTVASPVAAGLYGATVSWAFTGKNIDLRVTGFVNASTDGSEVRQYYDDLSSTFSDMSVKGIDRLNYGVEVGIEARFTRWLSLVAGGSFGEYRYNSEPVATVFSDATGAIISEGIVCYMSGLKTGSPQMVAAVELAYSDHRYWRASITGEWMGFRHVEINPLYHSSRIAGINPSPEIMNIFQSQERLPDAFTLGVSLSKGFVLKRGYLRVAASVRNLLSSRMIHSGYEQMRIGRSGSGMLRTLVPFPSKYLYSYPLTWSITLSYRI